MSLSIPFEEPPPPLTDDEPKEKHLESQQQSYTLHSIDAVLFIRQLPSQGLSFQLWPAAATFVALLDARRADLFPSGRPRILELGSGTGLVGIAAAAVLGTRVTVTDLPHVLPNLQFNIEANAEALEARGGEVRAAALPWGDERVMEAVGREFDLLVGSDVVYHEHLYGPLIETLRFLILGCEHRVDFLMAHLKRWKKESAFFRRARKLFDVEVVHRDTPTGGSRVGVTVYRFVRKGLKFDGKI